MVLIDIIAGGGGVGTGVMGGEPAVVKSVAALLNLGKYPLTLYLGLKWPAADTEEAEGTMGGGGGVGVSISKVSI